MSKNKTEAVSIQLTKKIRIFPTEEQTKVLWVLSEKCRLIYNFALAERREKWEKEGKSISYRTQQNALPSTKKKFPEYKWVHSKVLQMALKTLAADYASFRELRKTDPNANPPSFKGKDRFTTMCYNQSGYKLSKKTKSVSLSQFYDANVLLDFAIPESIFDEMMLHRLYQVNVFMKDERYFISIVYDEATIEYNDNQTYLALDPGIKNLVTGVTLEGRFVEVKNPRPDKYWNPIIDSLKSRRDKCKVVEDENKQKTYSRKRKRLHAIYKKCERKKANAMIDLEHKKSKKLIADTKANTLILGKPDVKSMAKPDKKGRQKHGLNRSTQNTGYMSRFARFLTYKAELAGKRVIEIDESYTTKTCYVCGKLHDMPIWKRTMDCDCGNHIDRDRNSAINIMLRFLSQNALWTSYRRFADNLRKTGLLAPPIVSS